MMNLLYDELLRVRTRAGKVTVSLPELLERLGLDDVEGYPGAQRHQEEPFHVFLCQLGAMVLARRNMNDPIQSAGFWREGLLELAQDDEDAWALVVDDVTRPAFMQPPIPEEHEKKLLQKSLWSPDIMDVFFTSKNHDVKQSVMSDPCVDDWIFALVSAQTMSGYGGPGNYGISRMNSGSGHRIIVEITHTIRYGARWRDAVIRLIDAREKIATGPWKYDLNGLPLVWLKTWDGVEKLSLSELDPFYVEVCRRIRLKQERDGRLRAYHTTAKGPRLAADKLAGNVGDPWTPIRIDARKKNGGGFTAYTASSQGITVDMLCRFLFRKGVQTGPLHDPVPGRNGKVFLMVFFIVGGQCKTEGLHEICLTIPERRKSLLFGSPEQRGLLAEMGETMIAMARATQNKVLKPAVFSYIEGGEKRASHPDSVDKWWEEIRPHYERLWSDAFFPFLWNMGEDADKADMETRWAEELRGYARRSLDLAMNALPARAGTGYRSVVSAENIFNSCFRRHFGEQEEASHAAVADE